MASMTQAAQPSARRFTTRPRRLCSLFALGLFSLAMAGCGAGPRLAPPEVGLPTPSPATVSEHVPPVATPLPRPPISEVVWTSAVDAESSAPTARATQFAVDVPSIIAAVRAGNLPPGSRIAAAWEYNDTSLDAFATELTAVENIDGRWISFTIDRDPEVPWPAGTYEITISLDGTVLEQASTEVVPS
jgi:hypothetical protein